MSFHEPGPDGIRLAVRLTPRAASDRIDGPDVSADGAVRLKIRVRAVPEDGKANAALIMVLAKAFSVPKNAVSLVSGHTSRVKIMSVRGDAEGLAAIAASFEKD